MFSVGRQAGRATPTEHSGPNEGRLVSEETASREYDGCVGMSLILKCSLWVAVTAATANMPPEAPAPSAYPSAPAPPDDPASRLLAALTALPPNATLEFQLEADAILVIRSPFTIPSSANVSIFCAAPGSSATIIGSAAARHFQVQPAARLMLQRINLVDGSSYYSNSAIGLGHSCTLLLHKVNMAAATPTSHGIHPTNPIQHPTPPHLTPEGQRLQLFLLPRLRGGHAW